MNLIRLCILMTLCIMSLPALSQNSQDELENGYKSCDSLSSLASSIMKIRQSGSPKNIALTLVSDLGSDAQQLVVWAYDTSISKTQEQREFKIKNFSQHVKIGCKKSVLKRREKLTESARSNTKFTMPQALQVMVGEWESSHHNNRYRIKIDWDEGSQELHGYLTKNGTLSEQVGFSINEHIFTARLLYKPMTIIVLHKYRSGKNGNSDWSKWLSGTITEMDKSDPFQMTASFAPIWDGTTQKSKYTKINKQP